MDYKIIDAHTHLWLKQDTVVEGKRIVSLNNGLTEFMGEIRQMMPPYMTDGVNSAERLLANMDFAQVSAAVVTQEFIDGCQDEYLAQVNRKFGDRLLCCGLVDMRKDDFFDNSRRLVNQGFKALKIPAQRLITDEGEILLASNQTMELFKFMESTGTILSIDLADGARQTSQMREIIQECPNLKIAIGHFGMVTRPNWTEQIKLALYPNVFIESGGITWLFNEEFYPYPSAIKAIKEAAEICGIEKLMWGSDYPRTMVAITYKMSYDFVLKSNLLSEYEKRQFLGENARIFYNFNSLPTLLPIKDML